jgi:hypothetical protein
MVSDRSKPHDRSEMKVERPARGADMHLTAIIAGAMLDPGECSHHGSSIPPALGVGAHLGAVLGPAGVEDALGVDPAVGVGTEEVP